MLRKIEELRKKPKYVRDRYAFWGAFLFTALIVVFYVLSIPARFGVLTGVSPVEKTEGGFSRVFSDMKASVIQAVAPERSTVMSSPNTSSSTEDDSNENIIDFATFFEDAATSNAPTAPPKPILIATTSSKSVSSSTE